MDNRIKNFMVSPVITTNPDDQLKDVIQKMKKYNIGSIVIINEEKILGIFTERDALKHHLEIYKGKLKQPIKNFMTKSVIHCSTFESYLSAYNKMKKNHMRHLPILEDEKLVGIISIRDLNNYLKIMTENKVVDTDQNTEVRSLTDFQLRNIEILTHLYNYDAVTDEIVETLRESELDYFSLVDKAKYLEQRVNIDEKTNLLKYNANFLSNIAKTASRILGTTAHPIYSVVFIRFDIDDFSKFNNQYGHDAGDEVLVKFAQILKNNSRPTDYIIRFGGEEFDVILPGTPLRGAEKYLEKIYDSLNGLYIERDSKQIYVTASSGVSSIIYDFSKNSLINETATKEEFKDLQKKADNAMYEAKYLGKNRYCIYSEEKEDEYPGIRQAYSSKKVNFNNE